MQIRGVLTELDDQEFLDFLSDFKDDCKDFRKWDVTDQYSMWDRANQIFYWIPLDEVPGCGQ